MVLPSFGAAWDSGLWVAGGTAVSHPPSPTLSPLSQGLSVLSRLCVLLFSCSLSPIFLLWPFFHRCLPLCCLFTPISEFSICVLPPSLLQLPQHTSQLSRSRPCAPVLSQGLANCPRGPRGQMVEARPLQSIPQWPSQLVWEAGAGPWHLMGIARGAGSVLGALQLWGSGPRGPLTMPTSCTRLLLHPSFCSSVLYTAQRSQGKPDIELFSIIE